MNVPPFLMWERLPGYERLRQSLDLTESGPYGGAAFHPEGFLRWLNRIRPAEAPKLSEVSMTAERIAAETAAAYKDRVQWWGG
jgi:hypothetical protein